MSRYDPRLEAGIIPGNLRAFKKDGQHLTLYGGGEFGSFVESGGGEAASSATESAADVDSFDQFSTPEESVTESLGDYEFGANYEVDVGMTPEQFDSIYGDSITQFPDSTTTSFTDAELAPIGSSEFTATVDTPAGPADFATETQEGISEAAQTAKDVADLNEAAKSATSLTEQAINNFSTTVSNFVTQQLPKLATDFAKNQLIATAKSVVASTLGNTPAGRAAAAALNKGIDKTAKAVDINSTGGEVFAAVSNAFGVTTGPAATIPQGTAFDDEGNLNSGWTLREDGSPVFLGGGFVDSTGQFLSPPPAAVPNTGPGFTVDGVLKSGFALVDGVVQDLRNLSVTDIAKLVDAQAAGLVNVVVGAAGTALTRGLTPVNAAIAGLTSSGLSAAAAALLAPITPGGNNAASIAAGATDTLRAAARQQQTQAAQGLDNATTGDWRVRLSLAPNANYLYNDPTVGNILAPLKNTSGVIFPYTPAITTAYKADYEPYSLTHSNFKGYFYKSSYVDPINIKATFTAQDTAEANYLLAVIHFFRSVTKMFYGQDANRGAPPPLVFLTGLGQYQFNKHPCVVASFDYSLPADVNYIRSSSVFNVNGTNTLTARETTSTASNPLSYTIERLKNLGQGIDPGAQKAPAFVRILGQVSSQDPPSTYVPTKIDINISLYPMQSRQQVSQVFSLTEFANGNLLSKGFW